MTIELQDIIDELPETEDIPINHRLIRYETAIEILRMMFSSRSASIYKERQKSCPDETLIRKWENEQRDYILQEQNIMFDDKNIERIIKTYAPIVRKEYAEE